jgi:RNA polymerase primary sigma factor
VNSQQNPGHIALFDPLWVRITRIWPLTASFILTCFRAALIIMSMAKFRLNAIATLARQLAFTPVETRAAQLNAAELLLHELDPARAYPLEFVVYRITGYQPKFNPDSDLLTGLALQHDLGLLIEQVSQSLNLIAQDVKEPVLGIEDVCEKFNVTSKTIQRWRRRGLPARRFIFPDGKQRVGFLLDSVERFIFAHQQQVVGTVNSSQMDDCERDAIIRRAHRLARSCCPAEIARRIGGRLHRSPLAILHTIRKHDAEHPDQAVFARAACPVTDEQRNRILRGFKRGISLKGLSRRFHQPRSTVYRVILDERIARLNQRKVKFIDDELYHAEDAAGILSELLSQDALAEAHPEENRTPRDLPPYLRELYRYPLLSASRERALFLKFNFHKWQFVSARRKLEPQFARSRDLAILESFLREAVSTKNQIIQANLRLVVSVARKHVRTGLSLMELVSEGNITLMRAVESFDIHKGNRFSTYATLALMKGFARSVPLMTREKTKVTSGQPLESVADPRLDRSAERCIDRDHVEQLLSRLNDRERRVLSAHYGLEDGHDIPATYDQLSLRMGVSKRHLRQIEQGALSKLRVAAKKVKPGHERIRKDFRQSFGSRGSPTSL